MSVQDGEKVNASVTNGAFVSKEVDDTKIGLLNLQDPSSANVDDVQGTINQNKTDIADHETRISQNETDIADHETRISTNETEIQAIEDSVGAPNGIAQLDGSGRLPSSQLTLDAVQYKGTWNASTNTPTLADGTGTQGDFYVVTVAGSQDLGSGSQTFNVNDRVFYNGSIWEQVDHTDAVSSVFGRTGAVTAQASDYDANQVDFDNTASGIAATNVQDAIDNVEGRVDSIEGASYVNSFEGRTGAVTATSGDYDANQVTYSNATSGLTATDTQGAIDEVEGRVDTLEGASYVNTFAGRSGTVLPAASDYDAIQVDYDNSTSGIAATDVQAAIDNIEGRVDTLEAAPSGVTSFEGRTGAVVSASGDYDASEITETTTKKFDIKHNRSAIVDPTATDDSTAEYQVGSHWFNSVSGTEFVCQDNTATAAVWIVASGAGGVGSPSIFGVLDAESSNPLDNWTTSAGTLSEETTSQLNGDVSYKYAPTAASDETESPAITIPLRAKDKITVMTEFVYNATHDGFRAEIRDNTSAVIASMDLPASETSARMIYNLTSSMTSLNFAIVDATHTASMEIVFDDVVFDDEPFRKIDTYEENVFSGRFDGSAGAGVSVVSENVSGTFTVSRTSLGIFVVDFSSLGLTEEPSVISIVGVSGSPLNATISALTNTAATVDIKQSNTGSLLDRDFMLVIQRQGADYKSTTESVVVENADGSEWTNAGAVTIDADTTNPTKGSTSYDNFWWRRIGDSMECRIEFQQTSAGTAGSGRYLFKMPNGYKIDSSKITINGNLAGPTIGAAWATGNATNDSRTNGKVSVYDQDYVFMTLDEGTSQTEQVVSSSFFNLTSSTRGFTMFFTVPIEGWSATEAHIIPIADPYENNLSARIANNGTASISSDGGSWVDSVNRTALGLVDVDYSGLGLTVLPAVSADVIKNDATDNTDSDVYDVTLTGCKVRTSVNSTSANLDRDFILRLSFQGADYKEPKGYFIGQSVPMRTAYVKDITASGAGSSSTLSGGSWTDMALNTVEGDSGFLSLSSNTITLSEGTYEIESIVPYCVNDSTFISYQGHHRIRNITASTTPATSTHFGARAGGNTAGHRQCSDTTAKTRIVLTASADFKIQAYINNSTSTGIGSDAGSGENNTHTTVKITKVK